MYANLGSPSAVIFQTSVNFLYNDLALTNNQYRANMADTWYGYLIVVYPGDYTFYLSSSDGSQLYIESVLTVSNGGLHTPVEVTSGLVTIAGGYHRIDMLHFCQSGGCSLVLSWECSSCTPGKIYC